MIELKEWWQLDLDTSQCQWPDMRWVVLYIRQRNPRLNIHIAVGSEVAATSPISMRR